MAVGVVALEPDRGTRVQGDHVGYLIFPAAKRFDQPDMALSRFVDRAF
jgi:hypothetical protein